MSKHLSLCTLMMSVALISPSCSSDNGNESDCNSVLILLGLERRDGDLADFVDQASFPDSPFYGQCLTISEIAERFGANPEVIQVVLEYLEGRGIRASEKIITQSGTFPRDRCWGGGRAL